MVTATCMRGYEYYEDFGVIKAVSDQISQTKFYSSFNSETVEMA